MNDKLKNELIAQYGLCIYDSIINNSDAEHKFIYENYNIHMEELELILICEDCNFEYSITSKCDANDTIFLSIVELGIKNFCDNDIVTYRLLQDDINEFLYADCEYDYKEYLKNKKIIANNK